MSFGHKIEEIVLLFDSGPLVDAERIGLQPGAIQVLETFILAGDLAWVAELVQQHLEEGGLEQKG